MSNAFAAPPAPDAGLILSAISALYAPSDVIELRAFHKGKKRTDAGYFDFEHRRDMAEAAVKLNATGAAVYVNLNPLDPQLLSRYCNRIESFAAATATDANVISRRWMLIDFDPVRPKDTSATEGQLEAAHQRARDCSNLLKAEGWPDPIAGESGNGWHLLYALDLPNDTESRDLVKGALEGLAARLDDDVVKVDQTVFNAGRITKLYGTVANKGDHTTSAPWRLSRLKSVPTRGAAVTVDQLRALRPAATSKQPSASSYSNPNQRDTFDLTGFLARLGIAYTQDTHEGAERYKLDHCPFNQEHGKGEAAIFRQSSGVLGFKCQHNSCADRHWQDVRALMDGEKEHRRGASGTYSKAAGGSSADDAPDKVGKTDNLSAAKALIELAVKNCDLFHDERRDGYAVTVHNGIRRTLKLRGREFRRWLAGTFYATTGKAANNEAISTALSVLEAKATFDGTMLELSNRFAMRDGVIYIDMADEKWRVIKVTADGWEVMPTPPVLFRRYSHQKALPDPVRGGNLSAIHNHLAIKSEDDKLLLLAWLVACAFPDTPRPIITFHGPQGASKSTTARVLKFLTDPSLTESVGLGKSPTEQAQVLDHHGVPCFDNLSSIPGWAADMLCCGVTGGAFSKRELFTDDGDIILSFKRPMIITGINIPTHAPDLLDRLLLVELERISPDKRMDEATFWAKFNADKAMLFGALLDGIAGALKYLSAVNLDVMPRMADFARIACAYAEFAGMGTAKMLGIIMQHTSRQTQEVLDSDPVASAIQDLIQKRGKWTGTAGELLVLLNEKQPSPRPDGWPKQANNLTRKINVLHATLNEAGISIRKHKEGSDRKKLLTLESRADSSPASPSSPGSPSRAGFGENDISESSSASSSAPKPSAGAELGDTDGEVDKSGVLSDPVVEVEV